MALDRPFDDGRVKTSNVAVSASTVSAAIMDDLIFMFTAKRPLYFRNFRLEEAAETGVSDRRRRRQQSFTQAAPNELKLGEGGYSDESWPSAWRWRRGVSRGQERRTKDQADPS